MAQVKFYSVSASDAKTDAGGIYFVTGGELYKGSSRFGANKVFTVPSQTDQTADGFNLASALTAAGVSANNANAIGGDILTGFGAAKVFNGTTWVDLGQDQAALDDQLKRLVQGLVFETTDNSYIKGITQDSDTGAVTAEVGNFTDDVRTAVGNSTSSSTANGITVEVTTSAGKVSTVTVDASQISCDSVTAASGTFTDLTVTDTATFSATTVSASTLTVGGSDISVLISEGADARIAAIASHTETSTANGVTVSVTTSAGSVTAVQVDATSFGNVMHFRDTVSNTANVTNPVAGDIVIITGVTDSESSFVNGQEYIYTTASTWELIGDQNSYALNAYAPGAEVVTAGTTTLPGAVHAIAGVVDTLTTKVSTLESAVTGGTSSSTVNGVTVEVVTAATTAAPTVTLSGVGTAASMDYSTAVANDSTLPTGAAVTTFVGSQIETAVSDLDAQVSSSNQTGLTVSVTEVDGKLTQVQAELVWLDASGDAIA